MNATPNHPDGFNGARDAAILADYADSITADMVRVQAVERTLDLLKRAGFPAVDAGEFYLVRVVRDRFQRLQLAAAAAVPAVVPVPQLLNVIDEWELGAILKSGSHLMQEKLDGKRVLVTKAATAVSATSRNGLPVKLPAGILAAVAALPVDCVLDGELVGSVFHAFDVLAADGADLRSLPCAARLARLAEIVPSDGESLRLVETVTTGQRARFQRLRAAGAEGIVLKDPGAPYAAGRPSDGGPWLKFKFIESASLIVTGATGKRSVQLGIFRGGELLPAGKVTIPANHEMPAPGAVVEVQYLYAYPATLALCQPVYHGPRQSIPADACTISQLKFKAA